MPAIGAAPRKLDTLAARARARNARLTLTTGSDAFRVDPGRAEARVRAARAFLSAVRRDVEKTVEAGNRVSTRQIGLVHLAKSEVREAGGEACPFAFRAAGGISRRERVRQRLFREMMTANNHFTCAPRIVGFAARDIAGCCRTGCGGSAT